MSTKSRDLLAVLIDADNVPAKFAAPILKEITTIGEPALRRVYGDWSSDRLKSWSAQALSLGLVAHQLSANTSGKNASDIGLVIDAMDILHAGRFDGFVLVSSDSDFTSLANRLREEGLLVIGIGEKKAPESLRNVCNRFIFIENITEPGEPSDKARPTGSKEQPAKAAPLILEAMDQIDQDDEWYHLGRLGQAISAAHPDFDTRTYGMGKLSDLVNSITKLETKRDGNRLMVRKKPKKPNGR
ncbi:NYN domain-containing protein [Rhodobacteraceae bacterium NNCM2]|nr:NYN domain-containing protein [Coraliihabitans acroporae]